MHLWKGEMDHMSQLSHPAHTVKQGVSREYSGFGAQVSVAYIEVISLTHLQAAVPPGAGAAITVADDVLE